MKRYIRASNEVEITDEFVADATDQYLKLFADRGFTMEASDVDLDRLTPQLLLKVISVNNSNIDVHNGNPVIGDYEIGMDFFISPEFATRNISKFSNQNMIKQVEAYIRIWNYRCNQLRIIIKEINLIEPKLPKIVAAIKRDFPGITLSARVGIGLTSDYGYEYISSVYDHANIIFTGVISDMPFSQEYTWDVWSSGEGQKDLYDYIALRYYRYVLNEHYDPWSKENLNKIVSWR